MVVPGMYDLPKVIALSGRTEEELFDCGITGELVFLVVVPELGACRVPDVALSHFMAGADAFTASAMPEHWTRAPSGEWTIKRDRLRILADSWERFALHFEEFAAALGGDPDASISQAALTHLKSLPPSEAKRWEAADRKANGLRQVTSQQAGQISTCLMTLEQFNDEVLTRLLRWRSGRYLVSEAAQILADAHPTLRAESLCEQMEQAIDDGTLILRKNGIPLVPAKRNPLRMRTDRHYNKSVLQADVNHWLLAVRAGYALTYPYEASAPAPADDVVPPQNSPEYQAEYARALEALERMPVVKKDIQEWENALLDTVKEKQDKVRNLAALKKELAALQEIVNPGQSEQQLPAPPTLPVLADGAPGDKEEEWKEMARKRAYEIIKRDKGRSLFPSQINIADEIAKEFRRDGVMGADGKPLAGAYIKRWALNGISSAQSKQLSTSIRRGK